MCLTFGPCIPSQTVKPDGTTTLLSGFALILVSFLLFITDTFENISQGYDGIAIRPYMRASWSTPKTNAVLYANCILIKLGKKTWHHQEEYKQIWHWNWLLSELPFVWCLTVTIVPVFPLTIKIVHWHLMNYFGSPGWLCAVWEGQHLGQCIFKSFMIHSNIV